jgi:hypothetical protein
MRDVNFLTDELTSAEREQARDRALQRVKEGIQAWLDKRRPALMLRPSEVGAMKGAERAIFLFKSLAVDIIVVCRENPRADTRLGVLALIAMHCDNEKGLCWLSIKKMAEALNRKPDNIRLAIKSLEEDGVVGVERTKDGMLSKYWIIGPRFVHELKPHPTWIMKAILNDVHDGVPPQTGGGGRVPPLPGGGPPAEQGQYITHLSTPSIQTKPDLSRGSVQEDFPTTSCRPSSTYPSSADQREAGYQDAPLKAAPLKDASRADLEKEEGASHGIQYAIDEHEHRSIDGRLNELPEYVHVSKDDRRTAVSQMSATYLVNAIKGCLTVWRTTDPALLDQMDTAFALLSMKVRLQRLGAKLPKGMPGDDELLAAFDRWKVFDASIHAIERRIADIDRAVKAPGDMVEQSKLREERRSLEAELHRLARHTRTGRALAKEEAEEAKQRKHDWRLARFQP